MGGNARFAQISSLLITSDGSTLWCGETADDGQLRMIDTGSRQVITRFREPTSLMCWIRPPPPRYSSGASRESVFYGVGRYHQYRSFSCYDARTNKMSHVGPWIAGRVNQLVVLPSGHVLLSKGISGHHPELFIFDPIMKTIKLLGTDASDRDSSGGGGGG